MTTALEAIADPVRLKIVRTLGERGEATLEELAAEVQAHLNTIRQHVRALEHAGLLSRSESPRRGPGRPHRRYRLRDGWAVPTNDFRRLAEILAGYLLQSNADPRDLERFASNWGRYLAGRPGSREVSRDLVQMLEQMGCSARIQGSDLVLSACPCPLIAPENPSSICRLITAVTKGFLEAASVGLSLKDSTHDPGRRICSLQFKRAGS